jgi:hypothetical protein
MGPKRSPRGQPSHHSNHEIKQSTSPHHSTSKHSAASLSSPSHQNNQQRRNNHRSQQVTNAQTIDCPHYFVCSQKRQNQTVSFAVVVRLKIFIIKKSQNVIDFFFFLI